MLIHDSETVLVVAAHPDDEVLGCGATIAAHTAAGDDVHVLILAEGATSRTACADSAIDRTVLSRLSDAAQTAASILGVKSLHLAGLPDNRMDTLPLLDVVKIVEDYIAKYSPVTVYTHHCGDLNVDHRITHNAVITACRPLPCHPVRRLLFFEIPSSTEWQMPLSGAPFLPNCFVDITNTIPKKLEALNAYDLEMRKWPHPRSPKAVETLALWRGATAGFEAAEAFMLGRELR